MAHAGLAEYARRCGYDARIDQGRLVLLDPVRVLTGGQPPRSEKQEVAIPATWPALWRFLDARG